MRNVGMRIEGWREMELQNRGFSFFFLPTVIQIRSATEPKKCDWFCSFRDLSALILTALLGYTFFDYFGAFLRSCCYKSGGIACRSLLNPY